MQENPSLYHENATQRNATQRNATQHATAGPQISPPTKIGERWRKVHKNPVSFSKILREIKRPFVQYFYAPIDIIFYRLSILRQAEREFPTVLSLEETVDLLIRGASICRFGDGEFNVLRRYLFAAEPSPERDLARRLENVIGSPSTEQVVIAIPPFCPKYEPSSGKYGWLNFWEHHWTESWTFLRQRLMNRTFGNAFVSRNAVFNEVSLEKIRQIWSGRDVVFIIGKNSRFFDEPRLFDNIKSVEYLLVEPLHAYRHYETVFQQALTFDKSKLFIICAGYMATALAFDLHHEGYQALDMGHLPNCFLSYLKEAPRPEMMANVIVR